MKTTFADLKFKKHPKSGKQAVMKFNNGYGISVLSGPTFRSDGKNTYEIAVLYNNELTYNTPVSDSALGWQTKEQVTEIMSRIQDLKYGL